MTIESKTNAFKLYVKDRIYNKKMDLLMAIVGERGSGKSWSALTIAKLLDVDFDINRVIFSYNDLIDVAEKREHKAGSVFIFDEVTADALQARNFMSKKNKNLSALLQTFRNMRYIVILTSPHLKFIDKQARMLLHMILIATKTPKGLMDRYRALSVHLVDNSIGSQLGYAKTWYGHPTWIINDVAVEVNRFLVYKPPMELVKQYEAKKRAFQQKLYQRLREDYDDGFGKRDFGAAKWMREHHIDLNDERSKPFGYETL